MWGRLIAFMTTAAQSPPPLAGIAGAGAVAQPRGGGSGVMDSDPNNVPCARRGTTAMANAVVFFGRMDVFVPW